MHRFTCTDPDCDCYKGHGPMFTPGSDHISPTPLVSPRDLSMSEYVTLPAPKPFFLAEPILYVDVDDTLVSWESGTWPDDGKIEFIDPRDGGSLYLKVIQESVDAIMNHHIRKHSIVVWSAGGAEWAREVVEKLNLTSVVHACMAKPTWILDDLPASEFIPERIRRDYNKKVDPLTEMLK